METTAQHVQVTSSPKPLESATITAAAWVQTLYPGILNISLTVPPPYGILAPRFRSMVGVCVLPVVSSSARSPSRLPRTPMPPRLCPGSQFTCPGWAHKASWTTWTPTPGSKLGHRKMISGGGRCKDETLENFAAMRRK